VPSVRQRIHAIELFAERHHEAAHPSATTKGEAMRVEGGADRSSVMVRSFARGGYVAVAIGSRRAPASADRNHRLLRGSRSWLFSWTALATRG
jgi:hypothetical protein